MGINGLFKFINKYIPDATLHTDISKLKGKTLIIDGTQAIYEQLALFKSKNIEKFNDSGENLSHIYGLISLLRHYFNNDIFPIFVFDSAVPKIKLEAVKERRRIRQNNLKKLQKLEESKNILLKLKESDKTKNKFSVLIDEDEELEEIEKEVDNQIKNEVLIHKIEQMDIIEDDLEEEEIEIEVDIDDNIDLHLELDINNKLEKQIDNIEKKCKKIEKHTITFKKQYKLDWIMVFNYIGLPFYIAEEEADPVCTYLLRNCPKELYGVVSNDSDMLPFGAPYLIKKSLGGDVVRITKLDGLIYKIKIFIEKMFDKIVYFEYTNFVEFCLLLGTDYKTFTLKDNLKEPIDILKKYVDDDLKVKNIIDPKDKDEFKKIKKYYMEFDPKYIYTHHVKPHPFWRKPDFHEFKIKLLELGFNSFYIDKNCSYFNELYKKFQKNINKDKDNDTNSNTKTNTKNNSVDIYKKKNLKHKI